jgi:hypothetical protein
MVDISLENEKITSSSVHKLPCTSHPKWRAQQLTVLETVPSMSPSVPLASGRTPLPPQVIFRRLPAFFVSKYYDPDLARQLKRLPHASAESVFIDFRACTDRMTSVRRTFNLFYTVIRPSMTKVRKMTSFSVICKYTAQLSTDHSLTFSDLLIHPTFPQGPNLVTEANDLVDFVYSTSVLTPTNDCYNDIILERLDSTEVIRKHSTPWRI